jgi:hypothetical protein
MLINGTIAAMGRWSRFAIVLAALAWAATPALAADSSYLVEVDDLPLAPGLIELPGGTLFESPQGRIVEANAQGEMLEVELRSFYDETLPQLGWTQTAPDEYRRDKEVLRFEITTNGMLVNIHFSLTPYKAPGATADDKGEKP